MSVESKQKLVFVFQSSCWLHVRRCWRKYSNAAGSKQAIILSASNWCFRFGHECRCLQVIKKKSFLFYCESDPTLFEKSSFLKNIICSPVVFNRFHAATHFSNVTNDPFQNAWSDIHYCFVLGWHDWKGCCERHLVLILISPFSSPLLQFNSVSLIKLISISFLTLIPVWVNSNN